MGCAAFPQPAVISTGGTTATAIPLTVTVPQGTQGFSEDVNAVATVTNGPTQSTVTKPVHVVFASSGIPTSAEPALYVGLIIGLVIIGGGAVFHVIRNR